MKIDWNWGSPPKSTPKPMPRLRALRWFLFKLSRPAPPMHTSNHYRRESFHPEDKPPTLF